MPAGALARVIPDGPPAPFAPSTPSWPPTTRFLEAPKPAGGFAFLHVPQLLLPWQAHRQGLIEPLALRAYLAAREMLERRCQNNPDTPAVYGPEELRRLLGLPPASRSRAAGAWRALQAVGLLTWSGRQLQLITHPEALRGLDRAGYDAMRAYMHPARRAVPVPRRLLRYLVREGSPGLIATTLGVLLRCFRYTQQQCRAGGAISATWIAGCFDLSERTAYRGLEELEALGWLTSVRTPRWHRHRYGTWRVVNLTWDPPPGRLLAQSPAIRDAPVQLELFPPAADAGEADRSPVESPPDEASQLPSVVGEVPAVQAETTPVERERAHVAVSEPTGRHNLAGPIHIHSSKPFQEGKHPKPAGNGSAGACIALTAGMAGTSSPVRAAMGEPRGASLRHLTVDDLHDVHRVLVLGEQASAQGWLSGCEADRLNVIAAAVHALRCGRRNPCGLFVAMLRGQRRDMITQDDEDCARAWLRAHDDGPRRPLASQSPSRSPPPAVSLSDDARLVDLVQHVLAMRGWRGDPFLALKVQDSQWTRSRWDQAQGELQGWRLQQMQARAHVCLADLGGILGAEGLADGTDETGEGGQATRPHAGRGGTFARGDLDEGTVYRLGTRR